MPTSSRGKFYQIANTITMVGCRETPSMDFDRVMQNLNLKILLQFCSSRESDIGSDNFFKKKKKSRFAFNIGHCNLFAYVLSVA